MRSLYEQIKQSVIDWSRRYVSDEDPAERRKRLLASALEEIHAEVLPVVQMRMAMRAAFESGPARDTELRKAA